MAIAYNSTESQSAEDNFPASTPKLSITVNVGSESERLLVVYVASEFTGDTDGKVTLLELDGTDVTTNTFGKRTAGGFREIETFYITDSQLSSIGTGNRDLTVDHTMTDDTASTPHLEHFTMIVQYFSGVDQASLIDSSEQDFSGSKVGPTVNNSITPVTTGNWVCCSGVMSGANGDITWSSPNTPTGIFNVHDAANEGTTSAMYATGSGNSPQTITFTAAATTRYAQQSLILREGAGGGSTPKGPLGHPFFGPFGGPIS